MLSLCSLLLSLSLAAPDDEALRSLVRPTEPLSPQDEQRTFHLPPGFEIQLFAAEPDLQKPMNMAFDAAGRLWVSGSVEYPYAAADGQGHDTIKVLADTDGDGRADKITTFVDELNIPIGLYPYGDGVVAYSIPGIWYLRDTDGDGRADRREMLYGPLGSPRDTHGMQNAFRRGFDGWLYINHGFSNETTITAKDGSSIHLQSGNTYRVRLDGSRVEQLTWGQVNPFGSTFLPNGDFITADCHSRPLTLLLRGAYYPSFGKPHDGLGFAPDLMQHSHGSTAIAGVTYYTGDNFPAEYQGHLFVGNVMTSRVNHDVLQYAGSTPRAVEQPDFLTSDDPWFRPVDLQIGPDGALYIADFYNRIIGHYEVPLDHSGRDRHRGRIWRVVYRGEQKNIPAPRLPDLSRADIGQLLAALAHPSFARRMLATDQLTDRVGDSAATRLSECLQSDASETARAHSLWTLFRLNRLTSLQMEQALADKSELVRIHALRVLGESPQSKVDLSRLKAQSAGPNERRAAAHAVAQQPFHHVGSLLELWSQTPAEDELQRYAWRLAIRNQLRVPEAWRTASAHTLSAPLQAELAAIAVAVPSEASAAYLLDYLREGSGLSKQIENQLTHLCQHLPAAQLPEAVRILRQKSHPDVDLQLKLVLLAHQRVQQRGGEYPSDLHGWGEELAARLLTGGDAGDAGWRNDSPDHPWGLEQRNCDDGTMGVTFLSSFPGGERALGTLRSRPFAIPAELSFFLCGHVGNPNQQAIAKNFIQLRLMSGDVIQKEFPPRNDIARRVRWDLSAHAGQRGYLELVDGLDLRAYAWLAVSRFEPAVVTLPTANFVKLAQQQASACSIVGALKLAALRPVTLNMLNDTSVDWQVRAAAARAELAFAPRPLLVALADVLPDPSLDSAVKRSVCEQVANTNSDASPKLLSEAMTAASSRLQRQLADSLASTSAGAESLLALVEQGRAAPRLLQDPAIRQKLTAARVPNWEARFAQLTSLLPPADVQLQRLIEQRRRAFVASSADTNHGLEVYRKHCAACHQVAGQGALIGPQLDGLGNRGAERVMEDLLDPNRNVDAAFQVTILTLTNGQVVSGLFRREEGSSLVFANQEGKEFVVLKADIDEQTKTNVSLMPANLGELLKAEEFADLIGYLLTLRGK